MILRVDVAFLHSPQTINQMDRKYQNHSKETQTIPYSGIILVKIIKFLYICHRKKILVSRDISVEGKKFLSESHEMSHFF